MIREAGRQSFVLLCELSPYNIRQLLGGRLDPKGRFVGSWLKTAGMGSSFLFPCKSIVIYRRHTVTACV